MIKLSGVQLWTLPWDIEENPLIIHYIDVVSVWIIVNLSGVQLWDSVIAIYDIDVPSFCVIIKIYGVELGDANQARIQWFVWVVDTNIGVNTMWGSSSQIQANTHFSGPADRQIDRQTDQQTYIQMLLFQSLKCTKN